jgi:hypothetical protein
VWLPAPCEWLAPPWECDEPLSLLLLLLLSDDLLSVDDEVLDESELELEESLLSLLLLDELPFFGLLPGLEPEP